MKNTYSVYEAKTHLSEILRQVKGHKSVVITDRGKEVARVVPVTEMTPFERRVADLEARGALTRPTSGIHPSKWRPITKCPGALEEFLKDRHRY
jgi:prevent-host-death family protein